MKMNTFIVNIAGEYENKLLLRRIISYCENSHL